MRPTSGPEVHVSIRRLSIDAACANADALGAQDLGTAVQARISERLGAEADGRRQATGGSPTISQTIADAVAAHVRPILGQAGRT